MPDHVHFLLRVNQRLELPLWKYIAIFKKGISQKWWCQSHVLPKISFFEPNFNDRLISRRGQVDAVKNYIHDNPRRLAIKTSNPEYFQQRYHIFINGKEWYLIGNIFLIKDFDLQFVKVSSRYSEDELIRLKRLWVQTVYNEGVLVSPFVSPKERVVRDWALENGGRIIQFMDSKFGDKYKPTGRSFDLCAQGRLLQIAPAFEAPKEMSKSWANELNAAAEALANGEYTLKPL